MAVNETANAIELEHVAKTYRVPVHRVETFKERVLHPFRSVEYRELGALDDVSFDIGAGEFFGIAGRNGSGKTTLLKLLASIYAPDSGTIRIAGRVAPFAASVKWQTADRPRPPAQLDWWQRHRPPGARSPRGKR